MQKTRQTLQNVCVLDDTCCWEGAGGVVVQEAHTVSTCCTCEQWPGCCVPCVLKGAADQASICVVAKCV